jgi:hypothetical protein
MLTRIWQITRACLLAEPSTLGDARRSGIPVLGIRRKHGEIWFVLKGVLWGDISFDDGVFILMPLVPPLLALRK